MREQWYFGGLMPSYSVGRMIEEGKMAVSSYEWSFSLPLRALTSDDTIIWISISTTVAAQASLHPSIQAHHLPRSQSPSRRLITCPAPSLVLRHQRKVCYQQRSLQHNYRAISRRHLTRTLAERLPEQAARKASQCQQRRPSWRALLWFETAQAGIA